MQGERDRQKREGEGKGGKEGEIDRKRDGQIGMEEPDRCF